MLTVERAGTDTDMLTGKEDQDGVFVTLADGSKGFLSWKSLKNYVTMRTSMQANGELKHASS